jgi:hypothetical protein
MEKMTISEFKATCIKGMERIRVTGHELIISNNGQPAVVVAP